MTAPVNSQATYTVRQLSERWQMKADTVRALLVSTPALRAFDVSSRPGTGKPRWRIPAESVELFEASRSVRPTVKTRRRKKRQADIHEFF